MNAENTHQVFDWLWTSGQLSEHDIAELPLLGVETVINLALPTSSNALPGEAELVTVQGMNYIHIPVVGSATAGRSRHILRYPGCAERKKVVGALREEYASVDLCLLIPQAATG
jgi:hypothetical protein